MREGLTPLRLVVWYSDGSRRECVATPEAWAALPDDDVQIVQILYTMRRKGRHLQELIAGEDHYWWHPVGGWAPAKPLKGIARNIPVDTDPRHIKTGRTIDKAAFIALYNRASEGVLSWP